MKKILILAICLNASTVFAMTTVNLNTATYNCNNVKITPQSTISSLTMNCKNAKLIVHVDSFPAARSDGGNSLPGGFVTSTNPLAPEPADATLDKLKFYTDDGSYMICYYNNNVFVKCKVSTHKLKTSASANTSKSSMQESASLTAESLPK